jgi:acyl-CoA thioester hydrolase
MSEQRSEHGSESRVAIRPRYGEVDSMGVVYHANYLRYFDMGRTELMRARGMPYNELERAGFALAVTEAQCRYIAPARYDERLRVRTELVEVGRVRMRFRYTIDRVDDGTRLAEGTTTLACLDGDSKPRRLPESARKLLGEAAR